MKKPFISVRNSFIYDAVQDKIEGAVAYGYRRAYKHTDKPTEDQVCAHISEQVNNALHDIFDINTLDEDEDPYNNGATLSPIGTGDIDDQQP